MLFKQVFKNNSTLGIKKYQRVSPFISQNFVTSKSKIIYPLNKNNFKSSFYQTNHFSFSKVSHLINPFTKQPLSDREYISDEAIVERITKLT